MRNKTKEPAVTVGVVPFEQFSRTAAVIDAVIRGTKLPLRLELVDCGIPDSYMPGIIDSLTPLPQSHVRIHRENGYRTSNQCKNILIRQARTKYLLLIENNCTAEPGYLEPLLDASAQFADDAVISCLQLEGTGPDRIHHEPDFCGFTKKTENGRTVRRPTFDASVADRVRWESPGEVETVEPHALFAPTAVFRKANAFDENINTRYHYDVTFSIEQAAVPMVLQPQSRVHYEPPRELMDDELEFFSFLIDGAWSARSNQYLREKWNCPDMLDSTVHIINKRFRRSEEEWQLHATGRIPSFYDDNPVKANDVSVSEDNGELHLKRGDNSHHLNETAAVIWQLCDGSRSAREIGYLLKRGLGDCSVPVLTDTIEILDSFSNSGLINFKRN